jgi:hypothetical protein
LNQATQSTTKHFCNTLIRYGFQHGRARRQEEFSDADLFPATSIRRLRKAIVDRDAASARTRLNRFTDGLSHLSLDAATVHGNAVLDIILLRTAPNQPSADYFLFDSIRVIESTFESSSSTVATAIEKLTHDRIQIQLIVGDGFSSQIAALSPDKDSASQNSPEHIERCPAIAAIFYAYCNCHLVNLALVGNAEAEQREERSSKL